LTRLNRVIRTSKQKHGIISTDICQKHSIAYIGISIKDLLFCPKEKIRELNTGIQYRVNVSGKQEFILVVMNNELDVLLN